MLAFLVVRDEFGGSEIIVLNNIAFLLFLICDESFYLYYLYKVVICLLCFIYDDKSNNQILEPTS